MSCKYWSKAPDAATRKNAFDFLARSLVIPSPTIGLPGQPTEGSRFEEPRHFDRLLVLANIENARECVKKSKFSTSQNVCQQPIAAFINEAFPTQPCRLDRTSVNLLWINGLLDVEMLEKSGTRCVAID